MTDLAAFQMFSPTTFADVVSRDRVMDMGMRPLWIGMPRVAGPAYPVLCPPGDSLMLHAAIYRAPPGAIIVATAGNTDYALAGGNVCAIAQNRGNCGFRRGRRNPGYCRGAREEVPRIRQGGIIPIPGRKELIGTLNQTVTCAGVQVAPGDVVVADEEGIVVLPAPRLPAILKAAQDLEEKNSAQTLEEWERAHRSRMRKTFTRQWLHRG